MGPSPCGPTIDVTNYSSAGTLALSQPPCTLTLRSSQRWVSLSPFIAACLESGFALPWTSRPTAHPPRGMRVLSRDDQEAISREVQRALDLGAIVQVEMHEVEVLSPVFCVPKPGSDSVRVIVDLRHVNSFLPKTHFKTTTLRDALLLVEPNMWMAKIDMKDAFWHLPLAPQDRPILCFMWQDVAYSFQVAPFGLSLSPLLLHKTTKPVMAHLGSLGIRCVIYVDDLLIVAPSFEECARTMRTTKQELTELGGDSTWRRACGSPRKLWCTWASRSTPRT